MTLDFRLVRLALAALLLLAGCAVGARVGPVYEASHLRPEKGFDIDLLTNPMITAHGMEKLMTQRLQNQFYEGGWNKPRSIEALNQLGAECAAATSLLIHCVYRNYTVVSRYQEVDPFGNRTLKGLYRNDFVFFFSLVFDPRMQTLVEVRKDAFSARIVQNIDRIPPPGAPLPVLLTPPWDAVKASDHPATALLLRLRHLAESGRLEKGVVEREFGIGFAPPLPKRAPNDSDYFNADSVPAPLAMECDPPRPGSPIILKPTMFSSDPHASRLYIAIPKTFGLNRQLFEQVFYSKGWWWFETSFHHRGTAESIVFPVGEQMAQAEFSEDKICAVIGLILYRKPRPQFLSRGAIQLGELADHPVLAKKAANPLRPTQLSSSAPPATSAAAWRNC
jgi:hypothetical protein